MSKINADVVYIKEERPLGIVCPLCGLKGKRGQAVLWLHEVNRLSTILHKDCMIKTMGLMPADTGEAMALMAKELMEIGS
jgi:hypothetical protein